MAKKTFMQGAVVLGIAGIIIKLLGAFFRIPLANLIGDEGMGYYQTAYPIYVLFLTLATAGIPIAISRMVAERIAVDKHYDAYRVFRVSFILLLCIGVSSASICFFGADVLVKIMGNTGAKSAMMAIAPALLFVPIMAAYRGYFQGMQDMKPTAVSQVVEQLFRVFVGLALAFTLAQIGLKYAAAGASFGATAGAIAGIITVMIIYLYKKKQYTHDINRTKTRDIERAGDILTKIFIIAIPITIGAAIMPIMNFIDVGIVMTRLQQIGFSERAANGMYGQYTGMAGPLINFPQVLTQAVAMSLVPAVATAFKTNDMEFLRENVKLGIRTSIIIGMPCALGLMVMAEPIMLLLYPFKKASALSAAPCLMVMAFGVIFLSTVQTLTGVLQGVGKQNIPVRNMFIGAIAKIGITYYLTGIASIGVKGAAMGTVAAYIIASTLNLLSVRKYTGAKFDIMLTFIKPLTASLVMALICRVTYGLIFEILGNSISTLISIFVAMIIYILMLFVTKSITKEEISRLPKGDKLVRMINKLKK